MPQARRQERPRALAARRIERVQLAASIQMLQGSHRPAHHQVSEFREAGCNSTNTCGMCPAVLNNQGRKGGERGQG